MLGVEIRGQRLVHERVEEGERHPPECALRAGTLYGLDGFDRAAHVLGAARVVLQPLDETALIASALLAQIFVGLPKLQDARAFVALGRTKGEIGIVEVRGVGLPASRRDDVAVQRIQPERLIGLARHQLVEISPDRAESTLGEPKDLGLPERGLRLDTGEQALQLLRYARDSFQPDDGKSPVSLVEVRLARL